MLTLELLRVEQAQEQPSAIFRSEVVLSSILWQAEQVGLQPVDLLVHRLLLYILSPPPLLASSKVVRTSRRAESLFTTSGKQPQYLCTETYATPLLLLLLALLRAAKTNVSWPSNSCAHEAVKHSSAVHAWHYVAQMWKEAKRKACRRAVRSCERANALLLFCQSAAVSGAAWICWSIKWYAALV